MNILCMHVSMLAHTSGKKTFQQILLCRFGLYRHTSMLVHKRTSYSTLWTTVLMTLALHREGYDVKLKMLLSLSPMDSNRFQQGSSYIPSRIMRIWRLHLINMYLAWHTWSRLMWRGKISIYWRGEAKIERLSWRT